MTSGNFLRRRTPEPKSAAGIRRRDLHAEDGNALLAVIGVVGVLAALGVAYQATVAAQSRTYDALAAGISNQNAADAAVSASGASRTNGARTGRRCTARLGAAGTEALRSSSSLKMKRFA